MKKAAKVLITVLCAVLLCIGSVFGTLAYLADSAEVRNTFTVGAIDIDLWESKVNKDGTVVEGADPVKANEYLLMPGKTYTKDPWIEVANGSQESFLFVQLANNLPDLISTADIEAQMTAHGWTKVTGQTNVYYYELTVTGNTSGDALIVPIFDSITISSDADAEDLERADGKTIVVTAYAIQADSIKTGSGNTVTPGDAQTAWGHLADQLGVSGGSNDGNDTEGGAQGGDEGGEGGFGDNDGAGSGPEGDGGIAPPIPEV